MISEATRKRVLEAVDRLGYVSAMAMCCTMAIGALIPEIRQPLSQQWFRARWNRHWHARATLLLLAAPPIF